MYSTQIFSRNKNLRKVLCAGQKIRVLEHFSELLKALNGTALNGPKKEIFGPERRVQDQPHFTDVTD